MSSAVLAMPLWKKVNADGSELNDLPALSPSSPPLKPRRRRTKTEEEGSYLWPFLVCFEEPEDVNKNTAWFSSPGTWSMYVMFIVMAWLLIQASTGCDVPTAWIAVNTIHFLITFYFFHWVKGSPFAEDQGLYNKLTWWEQMDGGRQHTTNRKFMTLVPVFLYLFVSLATQHLEHASSLLLINTVMVFVLVIAKLPFLHRIRLLGINA